MTLSEFKAWFEGYTEGLEGAPTKAQFDRIKEKVKEISGTPTSYPIFVDRYRQWVQPNQWGSPYVSYSVGAVGQATGNAVLMNQTTNGLQSAKAVCSTDAHQLIGSDSYKWDSHAAMYAVGKAEAAA